MRILIIEDEFKLADVIASRLKKEKYAFDVFCDGEEGLDNALTNIYDLIILDIMLPKINGFKILKEIRNKKMDAKVIILTAKSIIEDKLTGFNYGANDYITKPFHIEELIARVNAQLRINNKKLENNYLEFGDLKLDIKNAILYCNTTEETIEISKREFLLLEYLIKNSNQILLKEQIFNKVWGYDNDVESNNLEAYISFIRKKIKIIGSTTQIKSVRGFGYKIEEK